MQPFSPQYSDRRAGLDPDPPKLPKKSKGGVTLSPWDHLKALCGLPHRGSTTSNEQVAAAHIAYTLRQAGWDVTTQPFLAPAQTLYTGPPLLMLASLLIAWLVGSWSHWGAALLIPAVISLLVGELVAARRWNFDRVLPRHPSQNVIADRPSGARCTVVLVAHYDTQKGSWLFAPRIVPYLRALFTLAYAVLAVVWLLTIVQAVGGRIPVGLLYTVHGALALIAAFFVASGVTGRHTNGANDNASGVALLLALADRAGLFPPDVRVRMLFTGSEEVGMRGMAAYLDAYASEHAAASTVFVNVDNVGAGTLKVLRGEGMLRYVPYDEELVKLALHVGARLAPGHVRKLHNLLLPTDGLVPASRGYRAVTLVGADERGRFPHYHWHTDTPEHIDPQALETHLAYLEQLIRAIAATSVRETLAN